jgi:hypothetical protein
LQTKKFSAAKLSMGSTQTCVLETSAAFSYRSSGSNYKGEWSFQSKSRIKTTFVNSTIVGHFRGVASKLTLSHSPHVQTSSGASIHDRSIICQQKLARKFSVQTAHWNLKPSVEYPVSRQLYLSRFPEPIRHRTGYVPSSDLLSKLPKV